jgi:MscS family membrane protein
VTGSQKNQIRSKLRLLFIAGGLSTYALAQPVAQPVTTAPAKPEVPADPLGRSTPRGTVLGFLNVARKDNWEAASQYLISPSHGKSSQDLARELFVVLDRRLPARLNQVSDRPEGGLAFPTKPNQDSIGTIDTGSGPVDIIVERVDRGKAGFLWLFSRETLDLIPEIHAQVQGVPIEHVLPGFLVDAKFLQIPLFEWLAVLLGLPLIYMAGSGLNRILKVLVARIPHQGNPRAAPDLLSPPVRLLMIAIMIRWLLSRVGLSLLARQFWISLSFVLFVLASVWLLILLNGVLETLLRARFRRAERSGSISLLRFARRTLDALMIIGGIVICVYYFGLNPTAAIAGLGLGGVAVALAAQKTLENVIGGISLIFDHSIYVGEMLKISGAFGKVEEIGLRSTRIRTLDRTIIYVPNGQLANLMLENFSRRDKFWTHQNVNLEFETSASEIRSVCDGVKQALLDHPYAEAESIAVNVRNIGPSAFDLRIEAYLLAHDWTHFLDLQGDFLLEVVNTIEKSGARIAFPSQTTHFARTSDRDRSASGDRTPHTAQTAEQERGVGSPAHPGAAK